MLIAARSQSLTGNQNPAVSHCSLKPAEIIFSVKPSNAGDVRDTGSVPGLERSPGGGHDNPLQYSCLENPMARGAWQATVHRVTKS